MIVTIVINVFFGLVFLVFASLTGLYLYCKWQYTYWKKRNIPHANPSFPFGNLKLAADETFHDFYRKLYNEGKHEKFYGFWQLHKPILLVNDPELIKFILVQEFGNFQDHGVYRNEEKDPLSVNLFTMEGSYWKNFRTKLTPIFTSGRMKLMFPIVAEFGKEMKSVLQGPARRNEVIDVKDILGRYTTDVISSCAFGMEANSLKDPSAVMRRMGKKILEPNWKVILRVTATFLVPELARIFNISTFEKDVTEFFFKTFVDAIHFRDRTHFKRDDALQCLIELKNKKSDSDNDKFTLEQAAAQAYGFFFGSIETSSTTMQFTLYELACNQNIQAKVREEITSVMNHNKGELTYEAISEMSYLERVINETLRKYPPNSALLRICTHDCHLPDFNIYLKKGTAVHVSVYGLHMNDRYYPNPEKFDPDRFLENQKDQRHRYTYLPFGDGPRVCIGKRFAFLQMKIGLAYLLYNYKFDVPPEQLDKPLKFDPKSVFLSVKGGLHLRVSLVNSNVCD